jgi:DNA-binding NarL/FixJ family response regulator
MSHTILIVDDSGDVRRSLRRFIEQNSDWQVCGEAEDGKVAVEKVNKLRPDVVVLDFQMPVMNGVEAAREIARIAPNTVMLIFTMHNREQVLQEARAIGIRDVLSKSDGFADHLLASLKSVLAACEKWP